MGRIGVDRDNAVRDGFPNHPLFLQTFFQNTDELDRVSGSDEVLNGEARSEENPCHANEKFVGLPLMADRDSQRLRIYALSQLELAARPFGFFAEQIYDVPFHIVRNCDGVVRVCRPV